MENSKQKLSDDEIKQKREVILNFIKEETAKKTSKPKKTDSKPAEENKKDAIEITTASVLPTVPKPLSVEPAKPVESHKLEDKMPATKRVIRKKRTKGRKEASRPEVSNQKSKTANLLNDNIPAIDFLKIETLKPDKDLPTREKTETVKTSYKKIYLSVLIFLIISYVALSIFTYLYSFDNKFLDFFARYLSMLEK